MYQLALIRVARADLGKARVGVYKFIIVRARTGQYKAVW